MSYSTKLSATLKKSPSLSKARKSIDIKVGKVSSSVKATERKLSDLFKSKKYK